MPTTLRRILSRLPSGSCGREDNRRLQRLSYLKRVPSNTEARCKSHYDCWERLSRSKPHPIAHGPCTFYLPPAVISHYVEWCRMVDQQILKLRWRYHTVRGVI